MLNAVMYQVQVETKSGKPAFVGPSMENPERLYGLASAINTNVAKGQEKDWFNARVVELSTARN